MTSYIHTIKTKKNFDRQQRRKQNSLHNYIYNSLLYKIKRVNFRNFTKHLYSIRPVNSDDDDYDDKIIVMLCIVYAIRSAV